jgi:cytochrome b6-f complex iron-sulfur subunit
MERRDFIKSCGALCLGAAGMSALLQSCVTSNYYARTSVSNNKTVINRREFIYIKEGQNHERKFVIVIPEILSQPIFLYKVSENEYSAVLMYCTHKGCDLRPNGNNLLCPCHGSEFSSTGEVLNPPADKPLKKFETSCDADNVYIHGVK